MCILKFPIAFLHHITHNVLPAPYGFSSVGYEQIIPALLPAVTTFKQAKVLRSNALSAATNGPRFYFSPHTSGTHYTFILGGTKWLPINTVVPLTASTVITYATLQGISYVFFSGIGCYKWDSATNTLIPVTLTGLVAANILGITTYQGYMVAYDDSNIYWSSTLDIDYTTNAVDFVPSLTTGAGNIRPEGAKGPITVVLAATFGLAIQVYDSANSTVASKIFALSELQLEIGSVPTAFEQRPFGLELALCQRYYYRMAATLGGARIFGAGTALTTSIPQFYTQFPVEMRVIPTAFENSGNAADYEVYWGSGPTACTGAPTNYSTGTWGASYRFATGATLVNNAAIFAQAKTTSSFLAWSAEL